MRWRWVSATAQCSLGYLAEFCAKKMGGREQNEREGKLMKNSEGVERDQFLREIDVTGL